MRSHELTTTGLGDVRAQGCSFQKGVQYCGKYYWVEAAATTKTSAPATTASGAAGSGAALSGAPKTSTAASDGTPSTAASSDATSTTPAPADASSSGDAAPSSPASSGDSKSSLPLRVSRPAQIAFPLPLSSPQARPLGNQCSHPSQEGASKSCTRYVDVAEGEKCEDVLKKSSLKIEQFYKLNPAVKEDCTNLWPSKCCPRVLIIQFGGWFC